LLCKILDNSHLIEPPFCRTIDGQRCIDFLDARNYPEAFSYKTRRIPFRILLDNHPYPMVCYLNGKVTSHTVREFVERAQALKIALTSLWHIHTRLKPMTPLLLTTRESMYNAIFSWGNSEVQRILIMRYGIDAILTSPRVKVIHRDGDSVLFQMGIDHLRNDQYLKVKDRSTGRIFILRVPTEEHMWCCGNRWGRSVHKTDPEEKHYVIDTCKKAEAWTYYMRDTEYSPITAT
jgi:hypothetical protein